MLPIKIWRAWLRQREIARLDALDIDDGRDASPQGLELRKTVLVELIAPKGMSDAPPCWRGIYRQYQQHAWGSGDTTSRGQKALWSPTLPAFARWRCAA